MPSISLTLEASLLTSGDAVLGLASKLGVNPSGIGVGGSTNNEGVSTGIGPSCKELGSFKNGDGLSPEETTATSTVCVPRGVLSTTFSTASKGGESDALPFRPTIIQTCEEVFFETLLFSMGMACFDE